MTNGRSLGGRNGQGTRMTDLPDSAQKDPDDWVTGDEPATGPQLSYLSTLAHEAGEDVDTDGPTKADASRRIDELQERTGRSGDSCHRRRRYNRPLPG